MLLPGLQGLPNGQVLFVFGYDARSHTGAVKVRVLKIGRRAVRIGKENLENIMTSGAAEKQFFPVDRLLETRSSNGQSTETACISGSTVVLVCERGGRHG